MNVWSAGITTGNRSVNIWQAHAWMPSSESRVLAALEPAAGELSLTATERVEQERAELDRVFQQRRERAASEVERAAREIHAVEPEHRLVARTLEHAWEEKLAAQQQLEEEYHRFVQHKPRLLSETEREAIRRLVTDIPALWAAPTTTAVDRKEIIRKARRTGRGRWTREQRAGHRTYRMDRRRPH